MTQVPGQVTEDQHLSIPAFQRWGDWTLSFKFHPGQRSAPQVTKEVPYCIVGPEETQKCQAWLSILIPSKGNNLCTRDIHLIRTSGLLFLFV